MEAGYKSWQHNRGDLASGVAGERCYCHAQGHDIYGGVLAFVSVMVAMINNCLTWHER